MTKIDSNNTDKKLPQGMHRGMDSDAFKSKKDAAELERMIQQRKKKLE
jgi:hypothetical protein